MLHRIFKKAAPHDQRVHYRKAPGKAAALGVKLVCANGAPVAGVLMDLSAGGVAIEFEEELSHELEVGAERELVFSSLTAKPVRANAIVRMTPNERMPKRYGFEFADGHALFEVLDDSFYKYFNRRQYRRAKPALGEKVHAQFGFGNVQETVEIYDLSRGGASFYVPDDLVGHLEIDMPVDLWIQIPKTNHTLVNYAICRHGAQDAKGYRIGVAMEPLPDATGSRANKKAFIAYTDYLQKRIAEMDSYNSAYN